MRKSLYGLLAMMAFAAAFVMVGCGEKDGPVNNGDSRIDPKLLLEDGYAWVFVPTSDDRIYIVDSIVVVFNNNGTVRNAGKIFGLHWSEEPLAKYYTDGDTLYEIDVDNDTTVSTYTVSGNTLTITDLDDGTTMVFTKARFDLDNIGGPKGGEFDPALANTIWGNDAGDMWIFGFNEGAGAGSATFASADGGVQAIYLCSTSGGQLILTNLIGGANETKPYIIDGGSLTIDGETYTLLDDGEDWEMSSAKNALGKKLGKKLGKISLK